MLRWQVGNKAEAAEACAELLQLQREAGEQQVAAAMQTAHRLATRYMEIGESAKAMAVQVRDLSKRKNPKDTDSRAKQSAMY